MKKLLLGLIVLFTGMSSMFAWTNIIQLGVAGSYPENITTTGRYADSFKFNSTGIDLGYIGIFDNGLSLKANASCGIGSIKSTFLADFPDVEFGPYNFNATESIGVGYGIINNDLLYVGLFGNIGNTNNFAIAANHYDDTGYANLLVTSCVYFGGEAVAVFSPVKVFSLYASVSANVAFGTLATASASQKYTNIKEDDRPDVDATEFLTHPFLKIKPSIGIAWKF